MSIIDIEMRRLDNIANMYHKTGGLNVERKLIKLDIDYEKLTPKELKAMLDSMYKDDNKPIKNVTPEPETIESEEEKVLEKNSSES